jgi:hypothetical protein
MSGLLNALHACINQTAGEEEEEECSATQLLAWSRDLRRNASAVVRC